MSFQCLPFKVPKRNTRYNQKCFLSRMLSNPTFYSLIYISHIGRSIKIDAIVYFSFFFCYYCASIVTYQALAATFIPLKQQNIDEWFDCF